MVRNISKHRQNKRLGCIACGLSYLRSISQIRRAPADAEIGVAKWTSGSEVLQAQFFEFCDADFLPCHKSITRWTNPNE